MCPSWKRLHWSFQFQKFSKRCNEISERKLRFFWKEAQNFFKRGGLLIEKGGGKPIDYFFRFCRHFLLSVELSSTSNGCCPPFLQPSQLLSIPFLSPAAWEPIDPFLLDFAEIFLSTWRSLPFGAQRRCPSQISIQREGDFSPAFSPASRGPAGGCPFFRSPAEDPTEKGEGRLIFASFYSERRYLPLQQGAFPLLESIPSIKHEGLQTSPFLLACRRFLLVLEI